MFNDVPLVGDVSFPALNNNNSSASNTGGGLWDSIWGGIGGFVEGGFNTWTDYVQSEQAIDLLKLSNQQHTNSVTPTNSGIPSSSPPANNGGEWIAGIPNSYVMIGSGLLALVALIGTRK